MLLLPMRKLLSILCVWLMLLNTFSVFATTRYVAASAGPFSGGTACNTQTAITITTWNALTLSAGDNTFVCGTITLGTNATGFIFPNGGTSGNPVTLTFDTGADLKASYWNPSNGAVFINGLSNVVVNGGSTCGRQNGATVACNGTIENTANGTALANHQNSYGVLMNGCTPNCIVENLNISNIYVNQGTAPSGTDQAGANTVGIRLTASNTGAQIIGNIITTVSIGIQQDFGSVTSSNLVIDHNVISDMHWGINVGAGNGNSDISLGNDLSYNEITNWTNWICPANSGGNVPGCTDKADDVFHTDGMILFSFASTVSTFTATMHDNYIHGDLGSGSPTAFFYCAQNASCTEYNNLLISTSTLGGQHIVWNDTHQCSDKMFNNTLEAVESNDIAITFGTSTCSAVSSQGLAVIENNIATGVGYGLNDYSTLTADVGTSDHNVWQTPGGGAPQMFTGGATSISYATWTGTDGFDANSSTSTPNLNGSFVPQPTSSAIGRGLPLSSPAGLSLDAAGNARHTTGTCTPGTSGCDDAGAFMYQASGPVIPPAPVPSLFADDVSVNQFNELGRKWPAFGAIAEIARENPPTLSIEKTRSLPRGLFRGSRSNVRLDHLLSTPHCSSTSAQSYPHLRAGEGLECVAQ